MSLLLLQKCKFFLSFFLFFFSTLLFASNDISFTPKEQAWIEEHSEVIVGVGPDWAPFDFVDGNGNYTGIANDYLKLVSSYTGLHFKTVIDKWSNNLEKIQSKKIDLLDAVYYSDARNQYMSFTQPYLEILDYFYIRDDLNVTTLEDLNGKRVAIPKGYAHADSIRKEFPKIKIVTVGTFSDSIDAVLENRADMLFDTQIALSYKLEQDGIRNIIPFHSYRKHGLKKLYMSSYKGNDILISIMNKGLNKITKEQKREIYNRWITKEKSKNKSSTLLFSSEEKEWMFHHPIIRYSEINWEPMSIIEDGTMKGIMAEYLQIISEKTGLLFEYKKASSWSEVLQFFEDKKIDIIPGIGESEYESKLGILSDTYTDFPFVIITKNSESFISSLDELDGKKIAVPKYWTSYNYLKEQKPNIKLVATDSVYEALDLVKNSQADAFLGHKAIGMYYVGNYYSSMLHIAGRVDYSFNHKILIQKEDKLLQEIINKVFASISEKKELEIKDKWLHVEVNELQDYTLLYQIVGLFFLFFLGSFYWNRKLTREIRERKKVEKILQIEKENFKVLFEKVSNGNLIIQNEKFVNANEAALKMLAISDIRILFASTPFDWSPEFQPDGVNSRIKAIEKMQECFKNGSSRFEWLHKDREGREFWVDAGLTKIKYKGTDAIYVVWRDISEQKILYEKLVRAKKSADAANKSKSEFLANMSHEIRTPMNAIIGFTELLNEQLTEPRLKAYTQTIQNAGNSLLTLINDILDLSKIEAGKLEIHKTATNLFHLLNEVSSVFTMSVRNKGLDLIVDIQEDIPKTLFLDEVRLRQILFNLIGNAVKFTHNGYIKLTVYAFNVDEHHSKLDLEIRVEDSGIGIPKSQIEKIFSEFEQTEGQDNRKFGGTGLGLSISKRLCEMMDGKIEVESIEGEGATFIVKLFHIDISSVEVQSESVEGLKEQIVLKKAKILVVDDVEDNRELIIKNFEKSEVEILTANDGLEAIEVFKTSMPDLILMDIRMPNMDGYEASKEIKKISQVPIVALTASVMQGEYERAKSENFDGYLRKPVLRKELFSELSKFLPFELKEELSSEESKSFELSEKTKLNLGLILKIIDSEIIPLHEKALKTNSISDVKTFTLEIKKMADTYEIALLQNYTEELLEVIEVFDIVKMERLLKDFQKLVKELDV